MTLNHCVVLFRRFCRAGWVLRDRNKEVGYMGEGRWEAGGKGDDAFLALLAWLLC